MIRREWKGEGDRFCRRGATPLRLTLSRSETGAGINPQLWHSIRSRFSPVSHPHLEGARGGPERFTGPAIFSLSLFPDGKHLFAERIRVRSLGAIGGKAGHGRKGVRSTRTRVSCKDRTTPIAARDHPVCRAAATVSGLCFGAQDADFRKLSSRMQVPRGETTR